MTPISLGRFGDDRREAAGVFLHTRLVEDCAHGISVRRLGQHRAGEMRLTRFLHNDAVTVEEMVATAAVRTAERCTGCEVLVIQDTTVARSDGGGGLYLHVAIAVDAEDGALLGLVHATFLTREHGRRETRTNRPIEDKESQRWLDGAAAAARVCAKARRITMVADRESDIYQAFARRPEGVDLLVRAAQDRALDDGGRLFARLDAQRSAGRMTIEVPAKPGQKARTATLAVRFLTVELEATAQQVALRRSAGGVAFAGGHVRGQGEAWRGTAALAAADHLARRRSRRSAGGDRFLSLPLDDRAVVPHHEDARLRHRGFAHGDRAATAAAGHGYVDRGGHRPATAARSRRRDRTTAERCVRCQGSDIAGGTGTARSKATPPGSRTRIRRGLWLMQPGPADASVAGPDIMDSRARSSCSGAGKSSRPPSKCWFRWGIKMRESGSPQGEGEKTTQVFWPRSPPSGPCRLPGLACC